MAFVFKEFDNYEIYHFSGGSAAVHIMCFQGTSLHNRVGSILFYPDDAALPANQNRSYGPKLYFPLSRFDEVIATLRQEKPLYLRLDLDTLVGIVATPEREPVGEEGS